MPYSLNTAYCLLNSKNLKTPLKPYPSSGYGVSIPSFNFEYQYSVLDFIALTEEMDQLVIDRLRMDHTRADGQVMFASHAWRRMFGIYGPLVRELILEFFSTCRIVKGVLDIDALDTLQEPLRRLCHRLITFSINGRGQAPKKVTTTDLYYFRSMDEGTRVNIPYLLALCLFRFGKGRKQGARMSRGHFITRLGVYFRVITKEILKALTVVALGPERQQAGAVVGAAEVDPKVAQEGVQGDPTPAEAASMPQAAALHLGLCRRGC
ncbi:hypothetical protein Tco_1035865 [Tanacetum coccineum]